jgi:hypothetical protein
MSGSGGSFGFNRRQATTYPVVRYHPGSVPDDYLAFRPPKIRVSRLQARGAGGGAGAGGPLEAAKVGYCVLDEENCAVAALSRPREHREQEDASRLSTVIALGRR